MITVTSRTPTFGIGDGPFSVTLTGTGFPTVANDCRIVVMDAVGGTIIATSPYGTATATSFTGDVTFSPPDLPTGFYPIYLESLSLGLSSGGTQQHFTKTITAPTITAVTPSPIVGPGAVALTLTGTDFVGTTGFYVEVMDLEWNTLASSEAGIVVSPTQVTVTLDFPAGIPAGDVLVWGMGEDYEHKQSAHFQMPYTAGAAVVPAITGITPASYAGPGLVPMTVIGTGFPVGEVLNIIFRHGTGPGQGGASAGASVGTMCIDAASHIDSVNWPEPTPTGTYWGELFGPVSGSLGNYAVGYPYTKSAAPTITGCTPASGVGIGPHLITVTGTGFPTTPDVAKILLMDGSTVMGWSAFGTATPTAFTAPVTLQAFAQLDRPYTVLLQLPGYSPGLTAGTFTMVQPGALVVTDVSPSLGMGLGPMFVTLSGSGFPTTPGACQIVLKDSGGATIGQSPVGTAIVPETFSSAVTFDPAPPPGVLTLTPSLVADGVETAGPVDSFTLTIPAHSGGDPYVGGQHGEFVGSHGW